jgi:serpin B
MKQVATLLGILALLTGLGLGGWRLWEDRKFTPLPEYTPDMQAASDANNRFAFDLYAKLAEQEKSNLFFSPYSVHAALAMTATGARGETEAEMRHVLHAPDDNTLYSVGDLRRYYDHPRRDIQLSVANAIWGQRGRAWRAEWLDLQSQRFGSGLHEADFATNPDTERLRINAWVEEKTQKRITDLLEEKQIGSNTVQVLVNAIYFKGKWATEFDPQRTRDQQFHLADDRRIKVPMMYTHAKCGFGADKELRLVELPYRGGELSMIVILPRLPDGLPKLESQLSPETLTRWVALLKDRGQLEVTLPKFKLQQRYHLKDRLQELGMNAAFGNADFTGMAPGDDTPISSVTHQSFVEVNEEGTEAAAATAVVRGESSENLEFRAEHPFLFLIRDAKKGTILFMGRVMNPLER